MHENAFPTTGYFNLTIAGRIMRVLIVKTSSLGDIIHTLPALSDAVKAHPTIQFDWVVEESFQNIPRWHSSVNLVLPIAFRRWRKRWFHSRADITKRLQAIRNHSYDRIIDAQGLLKSALMTRIARGVRTGFCQKSAREPLARLFYQQRYTVPWSQHAVSRTRALFANALGYDIPQNLPDYGIDVSRLPAFSHSTPYYVFLHGTTWATKHWPEQYWISLASKIIERGDSVFLPWGNQAERERAERIRAAVTIPGAVNILPNMTLEEIGGVLANAKAIVSVDTGLGHLAAALAVPTVSLYGPTAAQKTGLFGQHQLHLSANFPCSPCFERSCLYKGDKSIDPPCFATVSPDNVWQHLEKLSEQFTSLTK
jgi:heptosyltransferase-1